MPNHSESRRNETQTSKEDLVREILIRVADKWTLLVIDELSDKEPKRFSRVLSGIEGISQRMLTKTLRALERDGLVSRKTHMEIPPRVEYQLTALGISLDESLCSVWKWAGENLPSVEAARARFDGAGNRRERAID